MTEQPRLTDARSAPSVVAGRYFSPATEPPSTLTGPATPIGTWIEPTMFSMADSAASAGKP